MNDNKDSIEEILSDFKARRENRENTPVEPLEPPKRREDIIDFAKSDNDEKSSHKSRKEKRKKAAKTPEELDAIQNERAEKRAKQKDKIHAAMIKIKHAVFNKKVLIALVCIIAAAAIIFGISFAVKQSKSAYLKPYEEKYPNVTFRVGMLEKYCDILGKNPDTVGYIEIEDIHLKGAVSSDNKKPLSAQATEKGATRFNYVVYSDSKELEKHYSTAESYNESNGFIKYSDLFEEYNFKIVGAFYTNTKAEDDDGYIFPYDVTEKMTSDSVREFSSRLDNRFLYSTNINITGNDILLTVSCPTDYKKDFRFVIVGVLCENSSEKAVAKAKAADDIRYQQIIYDEQNLKNPYRFSKKWYPEIIITDDAENETILQKTVDDFSSKKER